ncbi:hypothetical protein BTH160X_60318 [Brochothrix thermosphacta]|nr:hypothetical protein BTH160X_60318 [Brochothrix thermosphacta]
MLNCTTYVNYVVKLHVSKKFVAKNRLIAFKGTTFGDPLFIQGVFFTVLVADLSALRGQYGC